MLNHAQSNCSIMAALVDILPSSWLASFLNLSVGILSLQVTLNPWGCGFHSQPSDPRTLLVSPFSPRFEPAPKPSKEVPGRLLTLPYVALFLL